MTEKHNHTVKNLEKLATELRNLEQKGHDLSEIAALAEVQTIMDKLARVLNLLNTLANAHGYYSDEAEWFLNEIKRYSGNRNKRSAIIFVTGFSNGVRSGQGQYANYCSKLAEQLEQWGEKGAVKIQEQYGRLSTEHKDNGDRVNKTFFQRHWKWIITALLIPLLGWLANNIFKDTKKEAEQPPVQVPVIVNVNPKIEQNTTLKIDNNGGAVAKPDIPDANGIK